MPLRRLHHLDLAVADVERSIAFYLIGPDGFRLEVVHWPNQSYADEA